MALRRPGDAPFIMMTEFPRSGGNWIRDMLGDALQLPVPRFARFPVTFPSIVHNHDHRVLGEHKSVYVLRDGRDVFMSHKDKTITAFLDGIPPVKSRILKLHPSLAPLKSGASRDSIDILEFYQEWKQRPVGSRVNWGDHVGPWLEKGGATTAKIRYEDMRKDPEATLSEAVKILSPDPVPETTISFAVARNSFEAQTGRKPGEVDVNSTKRSGISGAWKTQMPAGLQEVFLKDFGKVLAQAGYET